MASSSSNEESFDRNDGLRLFTRDNPQPSLVASSKPSQDGIDGLIHDFNKVIDNMNANTTNIYGRRSMSSTNSDHSRSNTSISTQSISTTASVEDLVNQITNQKPLPLKQDASTERELPKLPPGFINDINAQARKDFSALGQGMLPGQAGTGFRSLGQPSPNIFPNNAMPILSAQSLDAMSPSSVRLQEELAQTRAKLQAVEYELHQSRNLKHTLDQALGNSPLTDDHNEKSSVSHILPTLRTSLGSGHTTSPPGIWGNTFDATSELADSVTDMSSMSTGPFPRTGLIWGTTSKPSLGLGQLPSTLQLQLPRSPEGAFPPGLARTHSFDGELFSQNPSRPVWTNRRSVSSTSQNSVGTNDSRFMASGRRPSFGLHPPAFRSAFEQNHGPIGQPGHIGLSGGYTPSPIGTPLTPTATEFQPTNTLGPVWGPAPTTMSMNTSTTYVPASEPLNYRRLLERSVNCNWKYIVDKIVCNNDQQASIFLQQKLKIGTPEQRHAIVEAIVNQAYPLMVNRFGNFLVQRCFEHGTPDQIEGIANAIRGNTLTLSMDAFGCHVIQKAFDCVNEDFKAVMVSELLRRIPETVVHRYACHVWQKLFELRWNRDPPQIMKYVNEALHGRWQEVALGETGSLVVQNIFENCLEEDKRPCVNEVLLHIDRIAHGQFGNWCIQHICEHGSPADRSRALDTVIKNAPEYSMDQYASKVVEKCLKVGGPEFLERYLDRVCEGRADRPRIPLIDIASDQYGNYLVQWILQHASAPHREQVASHIRKHMVSLRGSKFGSRVGMLCCNPSYGGRAAPHSANAPTGGNARFNGNNSRHWGGFR